MASDRSPALASGIGEARVPKKPVNSIIDEDEAIREATINLVDAMGFIAVASSRCAAIASIAMGEVRVPESPVISVVDDDESVREATTDLIKSMGFDVEAFSCPDAFCNSNRLHNTSCLIADVRMPGMSGLELYQHLLGSGKPIPTILITAFPNDRDRIRALRTGVICYLTKPFDENELLACIRSALNDPPMAVGGTG
jgi:FixJ family two-component response regulator